MLESLKDWHQTTHCTKKQINQDCKTCQLIYVFYWDISYITQWHHLQLAPSTYCTKPLQCLDSGAWSSIQWPVFETSFVTSCLVSWSCTVGRRRAWWLAIVPGHNSVLLFFVTGIGVLFLVPWFWIQKSASSTPGSFQGMLMPWLMEIWLHNKDAS
jgi:hypothetical protein